MEADLKHQKLIVRSLVANVSSSLDQRQSLQLTYASAHFCFRLTYLLELLSAFGIQLTTSENRVKFDDFDQRHAVEMDAIYQHHVLVTALQSSIPPTQGLFQQPPSTKYSNEYKNKLVRNQLGLLNDEGLLPPAMVTENSDPARLDSLGNIGLLGELQRPFEKSAGMILREILSEERFRRDLFILGAAHWKKDAYMSPVDDAIVKWFREHRNRLK